ncbi:crotonobetainyl-CoA--carnitine CoA-transferase [Spirillospora sp. NBC_01491]|uniref:crotonobetainyl-CoA--carnitine CoA-transferase n=1 Tax=Spirillospora sp. NBC_01491 TaxID=2976007 RepID=UPI002E31AE8D|nr:crotonobetainyl-CoA--carnitine CoA-transferase [Spirillospora sp. NBC_01491]
MATWTGSMPDGPPGRGAVGEAGTEVRAERLDLQSAAQAHVDRWLPGRRSRRVPIARFGRARVRLDEEFCREVAACYDAADGSADDPVLLRRYESLKRQNLRLYQAATDAGVAVEPWRGEGQPYRDSSDLCGSVALTRRLQVYLTGAGHGPPSDTGAHPLREPSGVREGGVEFRHNDLLRAVHDLFGHVMFGHGFGPKGEFLATRCQMHLYTRDVHPVLFTEQIGQLCWFFFGPHLLTRTGRLPVRGEPGYVPPSRRPYPRQKVFTYPDHFLDAFHAMFQLEEEPG